MRKNRSCTVGSKVLAELVCQECSKVANRKGWTPLSILFCNRKTHADSRADYLELRKVLEKYLGKILEKKGEIELDDQQKGE